MMNPTLISEGTNNISPATLFANLPDPGYFEVTYNETYSNYTEFWDGLQY